MDLTTLTKLANTSRTAPLDWRRIFWPEHPTTAIRTLITRGYVAPLGGGRLITLTRAGRYALWRRRQEQARQRAKAYGLLLKGGGEGTQLPADETGGPDPSEQN